MPVSPRKSSSSRDEKPNVKDVFCRGMEATAQVMVALDLGTTFSGFAYAHKADPLEIHDILDWPSQAEATASSRYCKTQTSLFYKCNDLLSSTYTLVAWGWPAFVRYQKALRSSNAPANLRASSAAMAALHAGTSSPFEPTFSHVHHDKVTCAHRLPDGSLFISCFKLYLAHQAGAPFSCQWSCDPLPLGLNIDRLITDYLLELSEFALMHLRDRYGTHLRKKNVQWCITVPAIWTEHAKQKMKQCAQNAGLGRGAFGHLQTDDASPHPLRIVLEPEAASLHCLHSARYISLTDGDRFAVIDVGGATIDIVVQEKLSHSGLQVKEIARSAGCLGGGIFVDELYLQLLATKIPCSSAFLRDNPCFKIKLLRPWLGVKSSFDGTEDQVAIDLPLELAEKWFEEREKEGCMDWEEENGEIILTQEDLCHVLDPEVDKVIHLLEQQMGYNIKAILLVGGFSASPYLMKRVCRAFEKRVSAIFSPPNPGSAISNGAVLFSMSKEPVTCRVSRKTYGIKCTRDFVEGSDPEECLSVNEDGDEECENAFAIYVRIGDKVSFNQSIEHIFYPTSHRQRKICLELYSSTEMDPLFLDEQSCLKEGQIEVDISKGMHMDMRREICVSMYFGRSSIEMSAKAMNFGDDHNLGMLPVTFDHAFDADA